MKQRYAVISSAALIGVALVIGCQPRALQPPPYTGKNGHRIQHAESHPSGKHLPVTVYGISGDSQKLLPRPADVPAANLKSQVAAIVAASTESKDRGTGIVPLGTRVESARLNGGTLTVSLSQEYATPAFWQGSDTEYLCIYGLVDSLCQLPKVKLVKILVAGKEVESLGGHVELLEALKPDPAVAKDGAR